MLFRVFHGPGQPSRVGAGQGGPTRPVRFRTPPEPTRFDPRDFHTFRTRPVTGVVIHDKSPDVVYRPKLGCGVELIE